MAHLSCGSEQEKVFIKGPWGGGVAVVPYLTHHTAMVEMTVLQKELN